MSGMVLLILSTLGVVAFTIWLIVVYAKNALVRKDRRYAGEFILNQVVVHHKNLKLKQGEIEASKGYAVIGDSAWRMEQVSFLKIALTRATAGLRSISESYHVFSFLKDMVQHLFEGDQNLSEFSVDKYVGGYNNPYSVSENLKELACWCFSGLFLFVGVWALVDQVWLAGLFGIIAGLLVSPLALARAGKKYPLLNRFYLNLVTTSIVAVFATGFYFKHQAEVVEHGLQAKALVLQQQQAEVQKLFDAEQLKARSKRQAEELALQQEFAANKNTIIEDVKAFISQEKFNEAKGRLDRFAMIRDEDFLLVKGLYGKKKLALDMKMAAIEREREQKLEYEKKILSYALTIPAYVLTPYTKAQYPKAFGLFGNRMPEVETLRRKAAEQAVDSGKCDRVELIEVSLDRSTTKNAVFFMDCKSGARIYRAETEIRRNTAVTSQVPGAKASAQWEDVSYNASLPGDSVYCKGQGALNDMTGFVQDGDNISAMKLISDGDCHISGGMRVRVFQEKGDAFVSFLSPSGKAFTTLKAYLK
jgi:hypothetical protein